MSGLVYSYLRFSDPSQASGHSSERQRAYAARWAEEHGLVLDASLSMQDHGLSAYHQRHVKSGALGAFLVAVEAGQVAPGSVLVVEGLDRLSRAEPLQALAQLTQLINAEITVVTAADGRKYSRAGLRENPMDLLHSIIIMVRAHEESDTKSKRVTAAILRQCRAWQDGTFRGTIRNGADPQWVRETDAGWELIPDRVEAVRLAATLYLQGRSGQEIVGQLAAKGISPTSEQLSATHLYKILKNPSLIGTRRISVGGEDFELEGYYPAALTLEQWTEVQNAGTQRGRRGAKKSDIPHVITGLGITYCGYCGRAMSGQHLMIKLKRQKPGTLLSDGYRRLLCAGKQYGNGPCPHPKSRSVAPVERAIMGYCSDILNLRALYGGDRTAPVRAELAKNRADLAKVEVKIERLMEAMLEVESDGTPAAFARKAHELESTRTKLKAEVTQCELQLNGLARKELTGADKQWRELAERVLLLDPEARLQARQLVADTFARIVVYASGIRPGEDQDRIDVMLLAKGGRARMLRIDPKGNWIAGEDIEPPDVDTAPATS